VPRADAKRLRDEYRPEYCGAMYNIGSAPEDRASVAAVELARYICDYSTKSTDTQQANKLLFDSLVRVGSAP
jgi:hypothetical protein